MMNESTTKHASFLPQSGQPLTSDAVVKALLAAGAAARVQPQGALSPTFLMHAQQQIAAAAAVRNSDYFGFSPGSNNSSEAAFLQAALAQKHAEKQQMIVNQLAAFNQASALNAQASALTSAAGFTPGLAAQLQSLSQNSISSNNLLLRRVAANQQALQQAQHFRTLAAGASGVSADLFSGVNNASLLLQEASLAQLIMAASHKKADTTELKGSGKYRDASLMPDPQIFPDNRTVEKQGSRRAGAAEPFPQKLHRMLVDLERTPGGADVASFLSHGRAFSIHNPKRFVSEIMPNYFRMSRFSSFQRQLNLYDFKRITEGRDKGAYYHEVFLHGRPALCSQMKRTKIKGPNSNWIGQGGYREEINFYSMPPVNVSPRDTNESKK